MIQLECPRGIHPLVSFTYVVHSSVGCIFLCMQEKGNSRIAYSRELFRNPSFGQSSREMPHLPNFDWSFCYFSPRFEQRLSAVVTPDMAFLRCTFGGREGGREGRATPVKAAVHWRTGGHQLGVKWAPRCTWPRLQ